MRTFLTIILYGKGAARPGALKMLLFLCQRLTSCTEANAPGEQEPSREIGACKGWYSMECLRMDFSQQGQ